MLQTSHFSRFNRILVTSSTNPHLNLAQELDLLHKPKSDEKILYLWRNDPVVVIGKHQNPYKECNLPFMKEKNILLARRPTGGGAVYQDLGNTCWTFLAPKLEIKENTQVLLSALTSLGIDAKQTGRNDIEFDGKKISGAAFRNLQYRTIHHGTMLMNVDMNTLTKALTVDHSKLKAKGVDSVRSRVLNLIEISPNITHEKFCDALIESFQKSYGKCPVEFIDKDRMLSEPNVALKYKQFSSKHWLFNKSSKAEINFSKRFPFGLFDVIIKVSEGESPLCSVHSDCLSNDVVEKFEDYVNEFLESQGNVSFFQSTFLQSLNSQEDKMMAMQLIQWIKPLLGQWI
ncbi:lipoyltransferase and lipoate-protein ligase containing protein [Tritrichomonas foetus]|uniref:Lipoyltransferase and lipoate-protein ligase containing protein n=1 Tax=Tritrichomonas foetus TaxID=1144522 RepID=A0A1J4KR16_9EUKA|nr:lipoyltransferase and lipoate-protein ligase containing protein [Tritrichomonas foetus]|eukprot:OHT13546.1 lipoyltransferase and lipoate-protein ligase containing protein [Tritrichomonas foetus]